MKTQPESTYLTLESLCGFLELVHFVLEVWGSFGQEHENVGLDFSTKDFRGGLQKNNNTCLTPWTSLLVILTYVAPVVTCSVNSMTRGSWLDLTKVRRFSLVISPSKVLRPSSNWKQKSKTQQHLDTNNIHTWSLPVSTAWIYRTNSKNPPAGFLLSVKNSRGVAVPSSHYWHTMGKGTFGWWHAARRAAT